MNKIPGIICDIKSEGNLSVVQIKAYDDVFTSIVIDTPATAKYLKLGGPVYAVFKANEVVIASEFSGMISMQNKFRCTLSGLETGKLLARVELDYNGFKIVSLITANAAIAMHLAVGDQVTAMVKTNEISMLPND